MSVSNFKELLEHVGHKIKVVTYKDKNYIDNVACECLTCNEVLMDFDNPSWPEMEPINIACPYCGGKRHDSLDNVAENEDGAKRRMMYKCRDCGSKFDVVFMAAKIYKRVKAKVAKESK